MMYTKITNGKLRHLQDHQTDMPQHPGNTEFLAGKIHLKVGSQIR